MSAAQRPTAAPLRLSLRAGGADRLAVRVLKRRGPTLDSAVQIELPPMLSEVARHRAKAGAALSEVEPITQESRLHAVTFVNLAAG